MKTLSADPTQNHLLAALPAVEWQRWQPQLERVELPLSQVLYESGGTLSHVYFPTTALVSLLYVMEDGASAEIAVVGNEGIVGISLFMGGDSTSSRVVVQSAGASHRDRGRHDGRTEQTSKNKTAQDFHRLNPRGNKVSMAIHSKRQRRVFGARLATTSLALPALCASIHDPTMDSPAPIRSTCDAAATS